MSLPLNIKIPGITLNSKHSSEKKLKFILENKPEKSRAYTNEYKVYYLITLIVVPFMLYKGWVISSPDNQIYEKYEAELSDGWLFNRKLDNSDSQWSFFRRNIPVLGSAMLGFVLINKLVRLFQNSKSYEKVNDSETVSSFDNSKARVEFLSMAIYSFIFLLISNGLSIIFILAIVGTNYYLTKKVFAGTRLGPIFMWALNIFILLFNEINVGYSFSSIHPMLSWMDSHRGINSRWDSTFNITMLRIMSFDMDYHWRTLQVGILGSQKVDELARKKNCSDKERLEYSRLEDEYSFLNYFAYLFYVPLYITGPIISFNDFVYQITHKQRLVTGKYVLTYGLRILASIFIMEVMLHAIHPAAITREKAFSGLSALEISLVGYFQLTFIWLKFMIIWRFARFFALFDGLFVIENMRRCMSNNYSLQNFWRDWHCSYNRFLIRYMYIPIQGAFEKENVDVIETTDNQKNTILLGKNKSTAAKTGHSQGSTVGRIVGLVAIFTFVAFWHDLELRLLAWAWIIIILFIPELTASIVCKNLGITSQKTSYFRYLVAIGGAMNIFTMVIANLVGFAVGVDGIGMMTSRIFCKEGMTFVITTYILMCVHVLNMYELRQAEKRREYKELLRNR
ncbi:hypothetical protein BB558_004146 [Smittium angustum]|uniref:Glycerol uptake protein 1 n=1 Tax=Smittium angustum TaxID=133377 RepID=A0A2U1J440_SMIAN|nr:hypothetical protein BB558_004146 [Smittium angustum]